MRTGDEIGNGIPAASLQNEQSQTERNTIRSIRPVRDCVADSLRLASTHTPSLWGELIMRNVKMLVGDRGIGRALTWAYPAGRAHGLFWIPTYELKVSGQDGSGAKLERSFEVFRFGILCRTTGSSPTVVGLADFQTHVIKSWIPAYSVHSAVSAEMGAWQVYDNFLIHDGPDEPKRDVYASIGCIEICNGPRGFDDFNDFVIQLSGPTGSSRDEQLKEIGRARNMQITYQKATRPPLTPV